MNSLAHKLQTTRPFGPPHADAFTKTMQHDVYPAISPTGDLAGSAKGMSILITGATGGIGSATALAFALAGAEKIIIVSRTQSSLNETAAAVLKAVGRGNVQIVKIAGDVTRQADVESIFEEAGDLDVLINNAGIVERILPIHETDPEEWWRVQEVNIKGTYLMTREFLKRNLGRTRLTVLNTSSLASMFTRPGHSSYQPGKSQINRFTEFIHFEYLEYDVRAFAFHPGAIDTPLTRYGMPKHVFPLLVDTSELAAGFILWLATQTETTDFLRGRYVSSNWVRPLICVHRRRDDLVFLQDVNELVAMKDEIVQKGLLWTRVVGQEQKVELDLLAW